MEVTELDFDTYRNRYHSQLERLEPRWAYGSDKDKLMDSSLHPVFGSYTIFIVETKDLIEKTEFLDFDPKLLFTGEDHSDFRVITTIKQWESGGFVDPPIITTSMVTEGKLAISDGRHRTKLAFILGQKSIPVAIQASMVPIVGKIIHLQPV